MNLRFFKSQQKEFSARQSGSKKWIYLETYTFQKQNAVHLKRQERPWEKHALQSLSHLRSREAPKYGVVSFYELGNFIG